MFNAANIQDVPLSLCLVDRDGNVLFANTAFELLTGDIKLGTSIAEVISFDGLSALIDSLDGKPVVVQANAAADRGRKYQMILSPTGDSSSILLQLVELDASNALSSGSQSVEKTDKLDFFSAISHQIRAPVSGVLGIAELLGETNLSAEQAKYVDMLTRSGHALIHLVNEIQEMAILEQGAASVAQNTINIRSLVKGAMDLFSVSVTQKGITGIAEIDDNVPENLIADRKKLHQILVNLMSNAFQYTDQGKVLVSLKMEASDTGNVLAIQVRDKGAGIDANLLSHVFKKSLPNDAKRKEKFRKTGLGLLLCKEFATLMGGDIEIDSKVGHGTSVRVTLPLEPASADNIPENVDVQTSADENFTSELDDGPWHLLVTEDNPVNQMLFKKILERAGHRVTVASNGQEAVAKVQLGNTYDAILMDISMPVMDGLDATAMIRSLYGPAGSTPILALTAHAMDGDREKFLNAGMDGYQSKPVEPSTLIKAIADIIRNRDDANLINSNSMAQAQSAHQASEQDC